MAEAALPSVQDHAKQLQADLIAAGKMPPAQVQMPDFGSTTAAAPPPHAGTSAAPAAPTFTESAVALPAPTETTGSTPPAAPPASAPAAPDPAAASGAAAAETAAQALADAFGEYEEFEIEDADLDHKIPIRVPKKYAPSVKRGYPRRADYDRAMQRYRDADPVLREYIESGQMRNLLPLIRAARENAQYGEYVYRGFERLQKGLPLVEAAAAEAAAMGAAPVPAPALPENILNDPIFGEVAKPIVSAFESRFNELDQRYRSLEAQRDGERQRAEEAQRAAMANATQMQSAHQDLERMFPGEYASAMQLSDPNYQRACQYARDAGYIESYGLRAGIIFAAQQMRTIEQERLAATASPAAAAINSLDQTAEIARREASRMAASVAGGSPASVATTAAPLVKPTPKHPNGAMKPSDQYLREMQAYIAAGGR